MDCSMPGFPIHHQHPEAAQTHIHRVGGAIQPSPPLSSHPPPAFNLPSIRVFSSESVLCIRWPKYWSFSFNTIENCIIWGQIIQSPLNSAFSSMLLLLLLSCFSHVRLCATPETAAPQAPPSLGFSRQEHWSGLPFPSPMHESEKWKWSRSGCLLESYTVVSDS